MLMHSFWKNPCKTYYKQPKHVIAKSKAGVDPSPLNSDPCMLNVGWRMLTFQWIETKAI